MQLRFDPERFQSARVLYGSRETIAARLGVSYRTIANWENGHTSPSSNRLAAIAKVLGKPIRHFYTERKRA